MADDPLEPDETLDGEPTDTAAEATDAGSGDETATEATTDTEAGTATKADAAATPKVVRKKVTSKRVTPKGSAQGVKARSSSPSGKATAADEDDDAGFSTRYTPPQATYAPGPSPWWVPALMFGLLIVGALVIMLNYMGAFGDAENIRLVIGLAFILGGIITATQYR
jgi:hypothetical protein